MIRRVFLSIAIALALGSTAAACSEPEKNIAEGVVAEVEPTGTRGYTYYYFTLEGQPERYRAEAAYATLLLKPGARVQVTWVKEENYRAVTSKIRVIEPAKPTPAPTPAPSSS